MGPILAWFGDTEPTIHEVPNEQTIWRKNDHRPNHFVGPDKFEML